MSAPSKVVDYASPTTGEVTARDRRLFKWFIVFPVMLAAAVFALFHVAREYTASRFQGITPGMTHAQVDARLWAFSKTRVGSYRYSPRPGKPTVSYQLPLFGSFFGIQVVFDNDGTVLAPVPIFDN